MGAGLSAVTQETESASKELARSSRSLGERRVFRFPGERGASANGGGESMDEPPPLRLAEQSLEELRKGEVLSTLRDDELNQLRSNVAGLLEAIDLEKGRRLSVREAAGRGGAEAAECVVCNEEPRRVVFRPCRHFVCCRSCGDDVLTCPMCRAAIEGRE